MIIPCFLVVSSIGLYNLAKFDLQKERDVLATRIGNAAARATGAIERVGQSDDDVHRHPGESFLQELLSLLMADQAVRCVELRRDNTNEIRIEAPFGLGCTEQLFDASLDVPVLLGDGHTLFVHFSTEEIDAAKRFKREFSLLVLAFGLLVTIFSSWLGFGLIVGRPLYQLLGAIRQSQATGQPARIETNRSDELGEVFEAFNNMQAHLDQEATTVRCALAQLDRVYNTTPALLCSFAANGIITSVSDHWAATVGSYREAILGQSIETFFDTASIPILRDRVLDAVAAGDQVHNIPLKLLSKDGHQIDILLSAIADSGIDRRLTVLCIMSDVSLLKAAERRLHQLALTDPLTGLPNRRGLVEHLSRILKRETEAADTSITAVLFIDLDNFKWINDTYGHEAGDSLLIEVGERLRLCVRVNDFIARMGGDEFAIICYRLEDQSKVEQVAQRIIDKLKKPFEHGDIHGLIGSSIGIAYVEPGIEGPDCILQLADLAMYDAKQNGKGCYRIYHQELGQKAIATATLREQIHQGLKTDGFSLVFQPIVDLRSEIPVGAEALLRLTCSKTGKMITPDEFIPVAEETGQIHELGSWVIEKSIEGMDLLDANKSDAALYLAINLSSRQLNDKLIGKLETIFRDRPQTCGRIVLEITETALLQRGDRTADLLRILSGIGVRIALDDFGTGYSSLSHIQAFPVDILKIDKSFVCGLGTRESDIQRRQIAMVKATSSIAQELGIEVVAEGIEDMTSIRVLQECGVQFGQGYLFSKPMSPKAFKAWHSEHLNGIAPSFQS